MSAIDYEPVWNKSRAFVRRALAARDDGQFEDFCFWCAVSLEMLGKAMLAQIHPALIADPQDVDSMFLACGKTLTSKPRTIAAKTVFLRLAKLSSHIDKTDVDFCTLMMERRNADLHSGALPYEGLNADTWAPRFWRVAELMLAVNQLNLEAWIDAAEAARAQDLIRAAATVRQQAVDARLERSRALFDGKYQTPEAIINIRAQARHGRLVHPTDFGLYAADLLVQEECPACRCDGLLSADNMGEEHEGEVDWESGLFTVTVHYASLAFRCAVCKLKLDGQEEMEHAQLTLEFDEEEQREAEYDDPYMDE